MPIRREQTDTRTPEQVRADEETLAALTSERVAPALRADVVARARARKESARARAAEVGEILGQLRRASGLSQDMVAQAIGTQRPDVSRIESGRHGGLTLERLIAILEVVGDALGVHASGLLPARAGLIAPLIRDTFFLGIDTAAEGVEGRST